MTYYGQGVEEFPEVCTQPSAPLEGECDFMVFDDFDEFGFRLTSEDDSFESPPMKPPSPTPQVAALPFPSPASRPSYVPPAGQLAVVVVEHGKSALSVGGRKKNQIKKGEGKDARKDPRDGYDYVNGPFFSILKNMNGGQLGAKTLFKLAVLVQRDSRQSLTPLNRWCKRRMPNAYSWLDENISRIDRDLLARCLKEAREVSGTGGLQSF
jgi:hypothetical protein